MEDRINIKVDNEIYAWLESKKIHPRQSFNEVLKNIKDGEDVN